MFLLDETDQRRIHLLEVLTKQPGWITIGELARLVDASERTIHSDLIYLKNKWENALQIDISLKNGVRMDCQSAALLHKIQVDIFKSGVAPRFLRDLFFFPHQNEEFYTRKLFISKSTFVRMIPKINAYLTPLGLAIERNELCYCLRANDELELRKLLAMMYLELNPPLSQLPGLKVEWPVPGARKPVSFSRLYDIVSSLLRQTPNHESVSLVLKDTLALPQMVSFYFVSILREQQGFTITRRGQRPVVVQASEQDVSYLHECFPSVQPQQLHTIHTQLLKPFLPPDDSAADARLETEAALFYQRVFEKLHVSCPPETLRQLVLTLKILYAYVLLYPVSIDGYLRRINGFVISMQTAHPKLYDAFTDSLTVFNRSTGKDLTASLPDLMLHSCFLFPALGMASPLHRVFIVSDSGIEHASFIASVIQSAMNNSSYETVQVTPVSYASAIDPAFTASLTKEDIFITTTPELLQLAPNSNTILFQDFPSLKNLYQLYDAIYQR